MSVGRLGPQAVSYQSLMHPPRFPALLVLICLSTSAAWAAVLDGKTPAYFVDRYGPAKSSETKTSGSFVHTTRGAVTVKAQFSVREYREGNLTVQAVFFLPSLELASVRLQLRQQWTAEQIKAALDAYGGEWRPLSRNAAVNSWVAPDGSMAISMLTWLDIQSKAIVDQAAKTLADEDAKRNAIPKF